MMEVIPFFFPFVWGGGVVGGWGGYFLHIYKQAITEKTKCCITNGLIVLS